MPTPNGITTNGCDHPSPALFHKVKNDKSILALAVCDSRLFAGTQAGEILVWSLDTCERIASVKAHLHSVLSLRVTKDKRFLFSSGGDAIVNVWSLDTLGALYSIYSTYDVGDVFCVAYSSTLETVYLGSQNTSIQWFDLSEKDSQPIPDLSRHPFNRNHRFFDSTGPGGVPTPRSPPQLETQSQNGQMLEIDNRNIVQYAHNGYVYCMLLAHDPEDEDSDEEILISGGGDGTIKLWSLETKNGGSISKLKTLRSGDDSVLALALDDTFLYSGRSNGEVNVWDLETCQLLRRVEAHSADVLTLSVGHGLIYSGSANGTVKQFDPQYECLHEWHAHDQLILASVMADCCGKQMYVTGGNDGCIVVWDVGEAKSEPAGVESTKNDQLLQSLSELVAFRTVSSKPEYAQECRRGASWLKGLFKDLGADTEMLSTPGSTNPVVFARFKGKGTPSAETRRILFYGHYDVVPAEDKQQTWATNPFEMRGVNGYLYGRGISDNKGPVMAAVYAAAELIVEKDLDMDVVFLIEGEEECGSRGFQEAIKQKKSLIGDIDWILLANSYWLDDDYPCLTYGLRGVVHATVQVTSERPNLHSGVDGSQRISEAMKDLINILAVLSNNDGSVKIPGFYDPVLRPNRVEDKRYAAISKMLVARDPSRGDASQLAEQLKGRWREPALTVHRITTSGPPGASVIPHTATATLSVRLVPNQTCATVQEALTNVLKTAFAGLSTSNKLTITIDHTAEPWLGDPENTIYRTLEEAVINVWGPSGHNRRGSVPAAKPQLKGLLKGSAYNRSGLGTSASLTNGSDHHSQATAESPVSPTSDRGMKAPFASSWKPLYIREGGSIPAIRFLEQEFKAPAAHLPCGQASDKAHLDNERLRLSNLYKSKDIFKRVFRELPSK
ncbi:MAG: hypothetical protein L6R41_005845 [Letrouitia leprolyta]|nr:MAG: hypothetical protein L6R41_005845 [Letrouitia leprolyta]